MKKIKRRSNLALIITLVFILGLCVFVVNLVSDGRDWAMLRANQSVFSSGVLNTGTVTDRNGIILAQAGSGMFSYADDETVRRACFHAVGDFSGNVGTGALRAFTWRIAGYNLVTGTTSFRGRGGTLALSIDSNLNTVAYRALAGRNGAVLVSNYRTGQILSMVSTPSYDPNNRPDISSSAFEGVYLNRGLSSAFTPGSIFKLVTLAAAIERIPDLYDRSFYCGGRVLVGGDVVTCMRSHGVQNIEQALANSCNLAFSELSQELGAEWIAMYADNFGLIESFSVSGISTARGGFEMAAAGTGALSWSGIGQHRNLVSPVAALRFVSAIANGGIAQDLVLTRGESSASKRIMGEDTAAKIADMMSFSVVYAYDSEHRFPGLSLSAKTGTAETGRGTSHAWFIGFLNDPQNPLAFAVFIEDGGGGLVNAGPVANAVLQAAVN